MDRERQRPVQLRSRPKQFPSGQGSSGSRLPDRGVQVVAPGKGREHSILGHQEIEHRIPFDVLRARQQTVPGLLSHCLSGKRPGRDLEALQRPATVAGKKGAADPPRRRSTGRQVPARHYSGNKRVRRAGKYTGVRDRLYYLDFNHGHTGMEQKRGNPTPILSLSNAILIAFPIVLPGTSSRSSCASLETIYQLVFGVRSISTSRTESPAESTRILLLEYDFHACFSKDHHDILQDRRDFRTSHLEMVQPGLQRQR